jgi:hypothetical protein
VQLVSRARLHSLHRQSRNDPKLWKHSREYLLAAIDGLRTKEKWRNLSLEDFPLSNQSASCVKNKRFRLNLDEDSDGEDYTELRRRHGHQHANTGDGRASQRHVPGMGYTDNSRANNGDRYAGDMHFEVKSESEETNSDYDASDAASESNVDNASRPDEFPACRVVLRGVK